MDDRRLLLEAYLRTGIGFLEDVDGDFAFVIWDERKRRVLAVRDRFAAKPLYFERTESGIRFASEPKQLVCTADQPIAACDRMIAEHILDRFNETRFTFFEGIHMVRPSRSVRASPSEFSETRYWNPSPGSVAAPNLSDVSGEYRERVVDSVKRRLESSGGVVSHLSGGLDSPSIAAAASILHSRNQDSQPFHTVSALFPGFSNDESVWIDEIVAAQPFLHHARALKIDDVDRHGDDMWMLDSPWIQRMSEMWTFPAEIAREVRANLLLSGAGGDEVLDQTWLVADLLRDGSLRRWVASAHSRSMHADWRTDRILLQSVRLALPRRLKSVVRGLLPNPSRPRHSLIGSDLWRELQASDIDAYRFDYGFPSLLQNAAVSGTQHPSLFHDNDVWERQSAYRGLGMSYPFLDRSLVEFVASVPARDRPFDGRSKAIVRSGFAGHLPASVLDRRVRTFFDDYYAAILSAQAPAYLDRYPAVSPAAEAYIDQRRYAQAVRRVNSGQIDGWIVKAMWNAWMLMVWLDGLPRYESVRLASSRR